VGTINRFLTAWIVFALLVGFVVGGSFVAAYHIPLSQPNALTNPEKAPSAEEAKENSDAALARYTKGLMIGTLVLAIATVALGIATVGLYITGEKQAVAFLKIANATELSSRAAIAIEMPIIRGTPEGIISGSTRGHAGPIIHAISVYTISFANFGRTEALPVEVRCGWAMGEQVG
jgi:hypothetical protein